MESPPWSARPMVSYPTPRILFPAPSDETAISNATTPTPNPPSAGLRYSGIGTLRSKYPSDPFRAAENNRAPIAVMTPSRAMANSSNGEASW